MAYDVVPTIHRINEVSRTGSDGSVVTSDGYDIAPVAVIRVPFVAGAWPSGDGYDIPVVTSALPVRHRIIDCHVWVSTAASTTTATLRDAQAGGGNALTDAMSTGTAGLIRANPTGGSKAVAAGGSLVLRRTSQAVAGEVVIWLMPEAS